MVLTAVLASSAFVRTEDGNLPRAFVYTLVLFHIATPDLCLAAKVSKSGQMVHNETRTSDDPVAQNPPPDQLPTALISLKSETGTFTPYAFLVDKRARTLSVWQSSDDSVKLVGAWPTDIGERDGDKLIQGDRRTPEGIYFFQTAMDGRRVDFSKYGSRIFTLDYPNYFDRLEKKTGTGIWFHSIPETKSLQRGSRGCVVVRNAVIQDLAKFIDLRRTPMLIVNHVDYVEPTKWAELRGQLRDFIDGWRASWVGKDLDKYMGHYSDRFHSMGMGKNQWRRYKSSLAERYKFIDVNLNDLQIFNQGPKLVFRFVQEYKSDGKQDFGSKIIYAQNADGKYQIVGENWFPASPPVTIGAPTTAVEHPTN